MAGNFLIRSRHETIFYFRRRIPVAAQAAFGRTVLILSLQTADRRLAAIRSRAIAAQTDAIFQKILMAKNPSPSDSFQLDFTYKIDFNDFGVPKSIFVDAMPEELDAVNDSIRTAIEATRRPEAPVPNTKPSGPQKPLTEAVSEYFAKSGLRPQSKATHKSKFNRATAFFGESKHVLDVDQAEFVRYCDHIIKAGGHLTTQGHYITTIATFLNWHRIRAGLQALTTKSLMPKRDTPETEDRDAYTLEQLQLVFNNAAQYRRRSPCKFWASIAPAFLGCRIEELAQVHLKTDFLKDDVEGIWYFVFDGRPDPDGVVRKSLKKLTSWRSVPIHEALVRHGFIDFLLQQRQVGHTRPFEAQWKPREVDEADVGRIIKWSHYISKWGGLELGKLAIHHQFERKGLVYFHSMRHTWKGVVGSANVSSEISEALAGRRYGSADAQRYEKLQKDHMRLYRDGIKPGLDVVAQMLDRALKDI